MICCLIRFHPLVSLQVPCLLCFPALLCFSVRNVLKAVNFKGKGLFSTFAFLKTFDSFNLFHQKLDFDIHQRSCGALFTIKCLVGKKKGKKKKKYNKATVFQRISPEKIRKAVTSASRLGQGQLCSHRHFLGTSQNSICMKVCSCFSKLIQGEWPSFFGVWDSENNFNYLPVSSVKTYIHYSVL